MSRLLKGLRPMQSEDPMTPSKPAPPDLRKAEMDALYARLRSSTYADSNEVRIQILGTMIYVLFTALYK